MPNRLHDLFHGLGIRLINFQHRVAITFVAHIPIQAIHMRFGEKSFPKRNTLPFPIANFNDPKFLLPSPQGRKELRIEALVAMIENLIRAGFFISLRNSSALNGLLFLELGIVAANFI